MYFCHIQKHCFVGFFWLDQATISAKEVKVQRKGGTWTATEKRLHPIDFPICWDVPNIWGCWGLTLIQHFFLTQNDICVLSTISICWLTTCFVETSRNHLTSVTRRAAKSSQLGPPGFLGRLRIVPWFEGGRPVGPKWLTWGVYDLGYKKFIVNYKRKYNKIEL